MFGMSHREKEDLKTVGGAVIGVFLLPLYLFYIIMKWMVVPTAWLIGLLFPKTIEEAKLKTKELENQAREKLEQIKKKIAIR